MLNKIGLKYGLIGFAIYATYLIVGYTVDLKLLINPIFSFLIPLAIFIVGILSQLAARKANGGFLDFTYTLQVYMITILISLIGYTVVAGIIFNVIDPAASKEVSKLAMEQAMEMADKMLGMMGQKDAMGTIDQDVMNQALEDGGGTYDIPNLLIGLILGILMFTVGGLISAAIIKKDEPREFN